MKGNFLYNKNCLLSLKEVLKMLGGVSKSYYYQRIKTHDYPKPIKIGRRSFWLAQDIISLIERLSEEGRKK